MRAAKCFFFTNVHRGESETGERKQQQGLFQSPVRIYVSSTGRIATSKKAPLFPSVTNGGSAPTLEKNSGPDLGSSSA